ncbi:hypothetical protein AB4182_22230 [Vibrio splendidus]
MENKAQYQLTWPEAFRDVANNLIDKLPLLLCFALLFVSILN